MGLFSKQSKTDRENAKLIERLDGRAVKYVTERDPATGIESVIGREGRINTKNGTIAIVCNGTEVFRCSSDAAQTGELLSLEGVIIKTAETMVVAYYKYYR